MAERKMGEESAAPFRMERRGQVGVAKRGMKGNGGGGLIERRGWDSSSRDERGTVASLSMTTKRLA